MNSKIKINGKWLWGLFLLSTLVIEIISNLNNAAENFHTVKTEKFEIKCDNTEEPGKSYLVLTIDNETYIGSRLIKNCAEIIKDEPLQVEAILRQGNKTINRLIIDNKEVYFHHRSSFSSLFFLLLLFSPFILIWLNQSGKRFRDDRAL